MRDIFVKNSFKKTEKTIALLPKRQIILFAADVAKSVLLFWDAKYPEDKRPLNAIIAAETFDSTAYAAACAVDAACAIDAAYAAAYAAHASSYAAACAAHASSYAAACAACAAHAAAYDEANVDIDAKWDWCFKLYENTLCKTPFQDSWKTESVTKLIDLIIKNRDFDLMPILFDALEDRDCIVDRKNTVYELSHWLLFTVAGA